MNDVVPSLTPAQTRTRNAILRAALPTLVRNGAVPLGEIADGARVARSTLYRYFPDREHLVEALDAYAGEEWRGAVARSLPDDGSGREAFIRLAGETLGCWDAVMWMYTRLQVACEVPETIDQIDPDVARIVRRGVADGSITAEFSVDWIDGMFWAVLYSANEFATGERTRHATAAYVVSTLERVTAPRP